MSRTHEAIDISDLPEVARLAEEVRQSRTPRELRRGDEVIARIVPATPLRATTPTQRRGKQITEEDRAAFLASAGSWSDVDIEKFKADLSESRRTSRPRAEL
jgi:hypothetical protein